MTQSDNVDIQNTDHREQSISFKHVLALYISYVTFLILTYDYDLFRKYV